MEKTNKYNSIEARCYELANGVAMKKSNNEKVNAKEVTKSDGPFYCPNCLSEAIVRKCTEKIDHFAHNARLSPAITSKDHTLHNKCRDEICNYLKIKYPKGNWKTERAIPKNESVGRKKDIIPDISGRFGDKNTGIPVAIEIQKSSYTLNKIYNKTVEYAKLNIYVIWIVPLAKDLGDEPFRPRLYEKYLHSMYYGRTFYWTPKISPKIIPIHYSPTKRYIDETMFFDIDLGEEVTFGGYYLTYRTMKTPNYGKECFIDTDLKKNSRKEFVPKNNKKIVPKSLILIDKQQKWWSSDEYKNIDKQRTIVEKKNEFLKEYEYFDDYDDEFYNEVENNQ